MTDPAGPPGDDLQRPLDESQPTDTDRQIRTTKSDLPVAADEPVIDLDAGGRRSGGADPGDPDPDGSDPNSSDPNSSDPNSSDPAALRPAVPEGPAGPPLAEVASHRPPRVPQLTALVRRVRSVVQAPRRAGRAVAGWTRRPGGRFAVPGLVIAALLAVALSTGAFLVPSGQAEVAAPGTSPSTAPSGFPAPTAPPGAPAPINTPGSVPTGRGQPAELLIDWSEQMSQRTGLPEVALRAYGYAELATRSTTPLCQLSWTTLAAIGRVESNHGSSGGATLLADGRALPPIFGLPLDGEGDRALILDTDGGELDQDPTYDRAVGPMQFIPSTWQAEQVDATGDGVADVHNINDAALAAANYLCRNGRDLTTPNGWWGAVLSYNAVQSYAEAVFAAANEFGQQSRAGAGADTGTA